MSEMKINQTKIYNPSSTLVDGKEALQKNAIEQANVAVDINSLLGAPVKGARYNPNTSDVEDCNKFQNTKAYKSMMECFNVVDAGRGDIENLFAMALASSKSDQNNTMLVNLLTELPEIHDAALKQILEKSELMKQTLKADIRAQMNELTSSMTNNIDDLPNDLKKIAILLLQTKENALKNVSPDSVRVSGIVQQTASSKIANTEKEDELEDVAEDNDSDSNVEHAEGETTEGMSSLPTGLMSMNGNISNDSNPVQGDDSGISGRNDVIEKPALKLGAQPVIMDDSSLPIEQEMRLRSMAPPPVVGANTTTSTPQVAAEQEERVAQSTGVTGLYDSSLLDVLNPRSSSMFLAFIMSYLQRSSSLFEAIQLKSRSSAEVAKLANSLLHKAQGLNNMMTSLNGRLNSLASKLKSTAASYGITAAETIATDLTMADLVLVEKLQKGQVKPYTGGMTEGEAIVELFLLKFDPALSKDEYKAIKEKGTGKGAYFAMSTGDNEKSGRRDHEADATRFKGTTMWNTTAISGASAKFSRPAYNWEDFLDVPTSVFGDTFNDFFSAEDMAQYVSKGTISMSDFNTVVKNNFAGLVALGFPASNFEIFKAPGAKVSTLSGEARADATTFYSQQVGCIGNYVTSIGNNLIQELQQKTANSGKESQDDWAKMMEQIQKFTDAGSQVFNAYAKAC